MTTATATETRPRTGMALGEIMSFAFETFCSNKVRFILTALGMVIGTASLILVVTIGMTGRQYVLNQIQAKHRRPRYAGRPAMASTATGLMSKHQMQLKAFLEEALG